MDDQQQGNAFAIPDLWPKSPLGRSILDPSEPALANLESQRWHLELDLGPSKLEAETFPPSKLPELRLPDLDEHSNEALEDLASLASSSASLSDVFTEPPESIEDDIWSAPDLLEFERSLEKPRCWESFSDKDFKLPVNPYLSEGGPGIFDALLSLHASKKSATSEQPPVRVLRPDPVVASLVQLGLGKDSILYSYSDLDRTFRARAENVRPSGFSLESFGSLEVDIVMHGNRMKSLQLFVTDAYASRKPHKALVSCAGCVRTILYGLETALYQASANMKSVLQLQAIFRKPGMLLSFLEELVSHIRSATSDEEVLSLLYGFAEDLEHSTWSRPIVFEILVKTSKPWLHSVGDWLGLTSRLGFQSSGATVGFIQTAQGPGDESGKEISTPKFVLNERRIPGFLSTEDALKMFETGQSLRIIQAHSIDHPLARAAATKCVQPPSLVFQSSWQDIHVIQARASQYEADLLAAMREFTGHGSKTADSDPRLDVVSTQADTAIDCDDPMETYFSALKTEIEQPLPQLFTDGTDDNLQAFAEALCFEEDEAEKTPLSSPPLSLVASLSFRPILSAQARLINQACLSLVFREHNLRSHLSLQYRYSLLSDGVFSSRLAHALFDPELPSAERRKGNPRLGVSGLKLGSRETWPPASSELRLALMGILSDSYYPDSNANTTISQRSELPGGMSFAIRAMSEDELQKCMDPNSIFALDFLRLQYRPPAPLDAVITQSSLEKYDTIFKLLLRATRMLYSVKQLSRVTLLRSTLRSHNPTNERFNIEANNFVSSVCSHFFEGVNEAWHAFGHRLGGMEERIERYEISEHEGLDKLREMHEKVLDGIMFGLLLRKRHEFIMGLLEDIFELVLDYARCVRAEELSGTDESHRLEERKDLYKRWKKKVNIFVGVCRGLSERKGSGGGNVSEKGEDENRIERLLLKLEMSGYYPQRTT